MSLEAIAQAMYAECVRVSAEMFPIGDASLEAELLAQDTWETLSESMKAQWRAIAAAGLSVHSPNMFADILEFHRKFGLEYAGPPRQLPTNMLEFRSTLMSEEYFEYRDAAAELNLAKQLDALVDLVYVVLGTAHLQGFDFNEAWRRVHAANMKKVRVQKAEQSKRGSSYDCVKPEGWQPPDLSDLV